MNSKDKDFLGKLCVKESSILIGLEKFWATEFSSIGGLGWYSAHQSQNYQISTHQSPLHQIFKSTHKTITPTNVT